ncbi:MAG: (deoxy)nucleoside triphosphate pyrophosphohydrolase [Actinomycetota bacterium]|nr:(deoxy)nucleoside triphosphate pyrophosphohydrolase [Actinomycetota bacterium]
MAEQTVVGAAIVHLGRVLAARRSAPAELAGEWEFPGGKVEAGESDEDALVRECREEIGVEIAVGRLLGAGRTAQGLTLRVYLAEHLVGFPEALVDHDELRWLGPDQLDTVRWLPADLPFVAAVKASLSSGG